MDVTKLKENLRHYNQDHLLHFWDEIVEEDKNKLINDISNINLEEVCKYFAVANQSLVSDGGGDSNKVDDLMKPLGDDVCGRASDENQNLLKNYESEGLRAISDGKVAVLLLAGGQGTRLGVTYPKGMYVVQIPSKKSLFQLQAERILRLQSLAADKCGRYGLITWYIMTSEPTKQMTQEYFTTHSYFGLRKDQVKFFMQGTLPCFDFNGRIILEDKAKIARAPDGNGGVYSSLGSSGMLSNMLAQGIEHIHVYCVDNILVKVADPHFIGYCASKHSDAGAKVVSKRDWSEPVGIVCSVADRYRVVEYSEIHSETAKLTRTDGTLMYNAANICNHYFSINYLKKLINELSRELCHHVAKKKIPYVSLDSGDVVKPSQPNGIKMEKFVFDVFPFTSRMSVWEVSRDSEFCPLKNANDAGSDCPNVCAGSLLALHLSWVVEAGGRVLPSPSSDAGGEAIICEISPLVSYAGEGLETLVSGKTFHSPLLIYSDKEVGRCSVMNEMQ